jgi:hypothetical protein
LINSAKLVFFGEKDCIFYFGWEFHPPAQPTLCQLLHSKAGAEGINRSCTGLCRTDLAKLMESYFFPWSVHPMKISQLFSDGAFLTEEKAFLGSEVKELSSRDYFKASFGVVFDQSLFWDLFSDRNGAIGHFAHLPSFGLSLTNLVCPSPGRICL